MPVAKLLLIWRPPILGLVSCVCPLQVLAEDNKLPELTCRELAEKTKVDHYAHISFAQLGASAHPKVTKLQFLISSGGGAAIIPLLQNDIVLVWHFTIYALKNENFNPI